MATCVFYIDESGDPGRHSIPLREGQTPLFTLTGLAFPISEWRSRDREYLSLKKQFFPDSLARSEKRPEEWEAKGNDLTKPHNADSARRHAFLRRVLHFISNHSG